MVKLGKFLLIGLITLCAISSIVAIKNYWQAQQQNTLIQNPQNIDLQQPHSDEVLFARAWYLSQQPSLDEQQTALDLYHQLEHRSLANERSDLWQASQYNRGLIHLRQAKAVRHSEDKAQRVQFMPLLELAIQDFKTLLKAHPEHYEARFSLEQALREIPENNSPKGGWKEQRTSVFSHVSGVAKGGP